MKNEKNKQKSCEKIMEIYFFLYFIEKRTTDNQTE